MIFYKLAALIWLIAPDFHGFVSVAFDGSTGTMPDTERNVAKFNKPSSRSGGGAAFPQLRMMTLMALSARVIFDLAYAPYTGKGTGERSLVMQILKRVARKELLFLLDAGQWTIQTMLPLHLCSVLVFLSAFMLATKNYPIYEFVYFLGIAGALQALLTPDAGRYGFPHFRFFQSLISHGSIVISGVWMTTVERYRPYPRSILRVAVIGNVYMGLVAIVNAMIGSNYLMIAYKPPGPSLRDLMPPWPWYIPVLEVLAWIFILLLYLPFAVRDRKAGRTIQRQAS